MRDRPKELPKMDPSIQKRHHKQRIFDQARLAIGRDLEGFLKAIAGAGRGMGAYFTGLVGGTHKITQEEAAKQVEEILCVMPRPWRSHQKVARREGYRNRKGRRSGLFYRNP